MNKEAARQYLLAKPEAEEDYPFGPDVMVFKIKGKMFALLSVGKGKDEKTRTQINLKCDPLEAIQLRDVFNDVVAGYHMNKKHWNTLYLTDETYQSDIPTAEIERQIDHSYSLVVKGLTRVQKNSLEMLYSNEQLFGK